MQILKCSQKLWHCYQKLQAPHLKGLVNQTLKHDLKGKWSGRINQEHSLIYEVKDDVIVLDANHFLAGQELVFDIELVEIVEG